MANKNVSVTKGLRKQNVQLVQHGSARRSAQRWETYTHQSSNICIAEMQNRSMFSSQKRPMLECKTVKYSVHKSVHCPTIQSRWGHQCGVSKGNALRLRLTGSVVQPMSCYDLLTYKAIGSNYLSFVVTSMLVFHIATG